MLGTRLAQITDNEEVRYQYMPDYLSTPAQNTLVTRRARL